jgi:hypothetical protein
MKKVSHFTFDGFSVKVFFGFFLWGMVLTSCSSPLAENNAITLKDAYPRAIVGQNLRIYVKSSEAPTIWMWIEGGAAVSEELGHRWPAQRCSRAGKAIGMLNYQKNTSPSPAI